MKYFLMLGLLLLMLIPQAVFAQGYLISSADRCDGVDVRFRVDSNVPYQIRLYSRETGASFGEVSGKGSGDPYVDKSAFVPYSTFPQFNQTLFVEMFVNNDFASPVTGLELRVSCASPGATQERGIRIIANPKFVVFVMPDFSLEYYEVINSQGLAIGYTPPGWRNDRLGRQLIHSVSNPEGARAELWHLAGETYYVDIYRNEGLVGTGTFLALGVPGGQGNFPIVSPPTAEGQTTTITVNDSSSDNGAGYRAQGSFDGSFYTVVAGDNLFRIALRFNTTLNAIMGLNPAITDPTRIEVGQRIRIP